MASVRSESGESRSTSRGLTALRHIVLGRTEFLLFPASSTPVLVILAHSIPLPAESMSAPNPRSLIEGLPTELLERICLSAPVYDVLRLSLVSPLRLLGTASSLTVGIYRSIALFTVSYVTLRRSNTRSISLVPGCNGTHGRELPWLIAEPR